MTTDHNQRCINKSTQIFSHHHHPTPSPGGLSKSYINSENFIHLLCASAPNCHFKATFPQGGDWLRSCCLDRFQHACKCCPLKIYQWASRYLCAYIYLLLPQKSHPFPFPLPLLGKENFHSFCPKTNFAVPSEQGSLLCLRLVPPSLSNFRNWVHNEWFSDIRKMDIMSTWWLGGNQDCARGSAFCPSHITSSFLHRLHLYQQLFKWILLQDSWMDGERFRKIPRLIHWDTSSKLLSYWSIYGKGKLLYLTYYYFLMTFKFPGLQLYY